MGASDFWNSQEHAQSVVQQVKALKNWVDPFESLVARVQSARELAAREGVEMPIVDTVNRVLFEGQPARSAIAALMTRELRAEVDR